ncbi:MAG TPA: M12 family metallo-peptidase, partial [Opitutaceae bacterium]|nr:M12 family metallo-peptidase [Opitutaceae bacterium]
MVRIRRLAHLAAAALAATSIAAPAFGANLFRYVEAPKSSRPPVMLAAPVAVEMDFAAVLAAGPGATLEGMLPNGKAFTMRIDRVERHANGDVSWHATVLDLVRGDLSATGTTGAAGTYAEIDTRDGTWGIVPSNDGHEWLFDKTAAQENLPLPQRADDAVRAPIEYDARAKLVCPINAGMPASQVTIDVLAVITPDFVSTHGGMAGAETRLNNIFANLNTYFANSNIAIIYRRVGTMQAAYQAASTAGDADNNALTAITNGTGSFANVSAIRNFYGADMVAMFRGPRNATGNSISGIAWVSGDENGNMPASGVNYMYSVSGDWLFPGATLPAHELGHNLGNNHDRPNAGTAPFGGTTTYSFGHFVCGTGADAACGSAGANNTGTGFGTIMAYHRPTVAKFSSPNLTCQGTQAGAVAGPCGVANQQDDVRATNCVRQTVANFKTSWVGNCSNLSADADNDGIPDCVEAGSGRVNGVKDNDIFTNGLLFSAQQYRDFLAREPEADGLNFWAGALASGTQTRGAMVESFFNSAEFQGVIAPVARLYFAYFRRIPDYAGLQYW